MSRRARQVSGFLLDWVAVLVPAVVFVALALWESLWL